MDTAYMLTMNFTSHTGIVGNEQPDTFATVAHRNRNLEPLSSDVRHFFRHLLRVASIGNPFDGRSLEPLLYSIDPELSFTVPSRLNRAANPLLHRLQLEASCTRSFLCRIRQVTFPVCATLHVRETVKDLILP